MARRRNPLPPGEPDPHGMRSLVVDYLEWMRAGNYSETTVEDRRRHLGHFTDWCAERGLGRPQEVTRAVLERYRGVLYRRRKKNGKPLSFRTHTVRLVAVRVFFKWLSRRNYLLYNPAGDLELPRGEKRLPRYVLTASEAERVLNQPDVGKPLGVRDRAILETFYSTGIRRSELIRLKVHDLDVERGTLAVRQGKGRKDRMVPVGERAVGWVDRYLFEVRPELSVEPDEGVMFLGSAGGALRRRRLTILVGGYVKAAEIGKPGSCHLFRHTAATLMLEGGADIRYIQQMLGHVNLESTQIYTQVSIRKLKEVHTRTHPGALLERRARAGDEPDGGEDEEDRREELLAELDAEAAAESEADE